MQAEEIKKVKRLLREQIISQYGIAFLDKVDEESLRQDMCSIITRMAKSHKNFAEKAGEDIVRQVIHDLVGYGPIQDLMNDPTITEIMVNGPYDIYAERNGHTFKADTNFDDESHVRYIIEKMLRPTGRRVDELAPYVDFSLDNGSRVNVVLPPVGFKGPYITVRKFLHDLKSLNDMIALDTLNNKVAEFLKLCVKAKINLIFSGATGSGKTTLLEILSAHIGEDERIVTIEDTLELHLRQNHVARLLTRNPNIEGKGEITIRDLFINTLRMRPDRIILGEVRGGECIDYLQALNSGHDGAMAVIHASTPDDVVVRLENLAFYSGLNIAPVSVRAQIAHGIDIIIQMAQIVDGSRKVVKVSEVVEEANGHIAINNIFYYKGDRMDENGRIHGRFLATGYRPKCCDEFEDMRIEFPEELFAIES